MLENLKKSFRGMFTRDGLDRFFVQKCDNFLTLEASESTSSYGLSEIIQSQRDRIFSVVKSESANWLDRIADKETRYQQILEARRALLHFLEQRVQCQLYFNEKWTDEEQRKLGKYFLPDFNESDIPDQQQTNYVISTVAFWSFLLLSKQLFKDENTWINEYTKIFQNYIEERVTAVLENNPQVNSALSRFDEPMTNMLLDWQAKNIFPD